MMSCFSSYLFISIKRALKKYTAVFVTAILIIAVLFLTAQMLINTDKNDVSRQKIRIGIVGDLSETYLGLGFSMLENMEDINMSLEFLEMKEDEAKKALESLDISAYLYVPDNYIKNIIKGKDAMLDFYMLKTSASAPSLIMNEIVRMITPVVSESESAIYAMRDYGKSIKEPNLSDNVKKLNIRYIDTVLARADSIDVKNTGIDSLSLTEYYACGIFTFLLLIFSVSCCMLFSDKRLPLGRLLCSKGLNAWNLVLCEYISYAFVMWITVFALLMLGEFLLPYVLPSYFEKGFVIMLSLRLIPCILMLSAMHFMIYELNGNIISAVLSQFVIASWLAYISGCFYPYYFFPQAVQSFASHLPSGICFEYMLGELLGKGISVVLPCMVYIAVFLSVSVLIRKRRLRRDTV